MTTATAQLEIEQPPINGSGRIEYTAPAISSGGPHTVQDITGPFSLVDNGPIDIAAVPGLVIDVRKGSLWAKYSGDKKHNFVHAGERFVSERVGTLTISTAKRSELQLVWP